MKCEVAGCEHEATVHEVTIKGGKKVERHLCEQHAQAEGIVVQTHAPISEILSKFVMSQSGATAQRAEKGVRCPGCGLAWSDFREKGLLGCPQCYEVFEEQLTPLLQRAHEGATHHVGKTPGKAEETIDLHQRLTTLRRDLEDAVASEEYERAASIRDQIRTIQERSQDADISGRRGSSNGGPESSTGEGGA